jgi:hypothetical protein
MTTTL